MAISVDLQSFFGRHARKWRSESANKLRRGQGWDGRFLALKKHDNGRPLAFHKSGLGIPGRIDGGTVVAQKTGFKVTVAQKLADQIFDEGKFNQVERPFAGISVAFQDRLLTDLISELIRAGKRAKLFK